jgi:hypothetical protein
MPYSFGAGGGAIIPISGAPSSGTNQVDTLTIGGTPTGGTFRLAIGGIRTAAITWVNVNATLLASINTALDAVAGASQIVATAGTVTAGIGTILLTYSGSSYARASYSAIAVSDNSLTGTSPTLAVATTTAGVEATLRGCPRGTLCVDTATGTVYRNTSGTPNIPAFVSP